MPVPFPGQDPDTPTETVKIEDFGSLNTKAGRVAIAPNESPWIENFMPIGPANMRTLYAEDEPIYTASGSLSIIYSYDFNIAADTFKAVFLDDGTADQVAVPSGTVIPISSTPGTFYPGVTPGLPACAQWESKYLAICSPLASDGYWVWDGQSLFGPGTIAPGVTILDSGNDYTSPPTITAYGGAGSGATFTGTIANGRLTDIKVDTPGSGYALDDKITLIITGGGSDDQARATAVISNDMGVGACLITDGGTGYTADVAVVFSGGGGSGAAAVVTGAANGVLTEITVTNPGVGYTSAPTVSFTATAGSGATAAPEMRRGTIASITVDDGGSGYSGAPSVVISEPDIPDFPIVQAEAYAVVTAGAVTSIVVTVNGLGYSQATVDLSGGNNAAEASVLLMPYGIAGDTVETYQGHVWVSNVTKTSYTGPQSVSDFSTVNGGGSFPATDSFLRRKITRLAQANGFLYLIADSSINVISNVQTSGVPATTTFNNANIDPQVGTPWRDSVASFGRALVFANATGVYALYGGAAEKVSAPLDGLFATASFNTNQSGVEPSASVANLYGIKVYVLLFTTTDSYTKQLRKIMAIWDGQKWFVGTQLVTPTAITTQEIDSQLASWGHDGKHIYKLFQVPSIFLKKVWQSKLMAEHGYWEATQVNQVAYVAQTNSSTEATIQIGIDTERGLGNTTTRQVSGLLSFYGTGPIQFTGAGGANLNFSASNLAVGSYAEAQYGNFIGITLTTQADDLTFISIGLIQNEYAPTDGGTGGV